jgi:hypothetical protein
MNIITYDDYLKSSRTEDYIPPTHVIKPPDNDKIYKFVEDEFADRKEYFKVGISSTNNNVFK